MLNKKRPNKKQLQALLKATHTKSSGNIEQLTNRILNLEQTVHASFFVDADKELGERRPNGKRFLLAGLKNSLEQTLGLRNRTLSPTIEFLDNKEFQGRAEKIETSHEPESGLIDCLVDSRFRTNKLICNFCSKRQTCNDEESRSFKELVQYDILSYQNPTDLGDIDRIKSWLQDFNKPFDKTNHLHQENMIFSDKLNPFKPGFSIQKGSKLFITRLDEAKAPNNNDVHNWNHLYYSEVLGRTLTIFEAVYLNSVIQTQKFKQSNKFPTVRETRDFFSTAQIHNKRVSRRNISNKLSMYIQPDSQELMLENEFLYSVLHQTESLFESGLYNEKLEIFSFHRPKKGFSEHLIELWFEVINAIYSENLKEMESHVFEPRIQAQIFFPDIFKTTTTDLTLPLHFQILRLIPIKQLAEPWIMLNSPVPKTSYINNQHGKPFPKSWLNCELLISEKIEKLLIDNPRKYLPTIWPNHDQQNLQPKTSHTRLNIFPPCEIFSAMSMNLLFKKYINSPGDSNQKRIQYQFQNLLREVFFQLLEDDTYTLNAMDKENLILFQNEVSNPKYKRYKPLETLLKMSEKGFNKENNSNKQFIEYQKSTRDLETIEKFWIRSPNYMDESGASSDNLEWVFVKKSEIDIHGRITNNKSNRWEYSLLESSGRKIRLQSSRIENFCELLNWKPFKERSAELKTTEIQNMYVSEEISKLLSASNTLSEKAWARITKVLNQYGVFGCTFFISPKELYEINQFVGELEYRQIYLHDFNVRILYANPNEAVTNLSPNFLHVGVLTD